MADMMTFPDTVEEFMEQYKTVDTEQIYSNGIEYVPIFRMRQWFEHKPERKKGKWIRWYEEIEDDIGTEYRPHCKCSECGMEYDPYTVKFINFCPNCGSDMRGEEE